MAKKNKVSTKLLKCDKCGAEAAGTSGQLGKRHIKCNKKIKGVFEVGPRRRKVSFGFHSKKDSGKWRSMTLDEQLIRDERIKEENLCQEKKRLQTSKG